MTAGRYVATRYQNAVVDALRTLEAGNPDRPGFTARRIAAELVGTQTGDSVRKVLNVLERQGAVTTVTSYPQPHGGAKLWHTATPDVPDHPPPLDHP